MSLISCAECGNVVSDKATACPRCGAPVEAQPRAIPASEAPSPTAPQPKAKGCIQAVLAFIAVAAFLSYCGHQDDTLTRGSDSQEVIRARRAAEQARVAALTPAQRAAEEKAQAAVVAEAQRRANLAAAEQAQLKSAKDAEDAAFAQIMQARRAVTSSMRDPDSAEFRKVVAVEAGAKGIYAVCGEVNGRNGFGGMTGFSSFLYLVGVVEIEGPTNGAKFAKSWNSICAKKRPLATWK